MAIKNYLKSVKDITAPLNWKSSPDSPKTQLAYITNAEKDLLVKSNLHGSMKGKPNKGPMGIISLDGMGKEDTSEPEKKTRSDGGSYGRDLGVTIDVSTKEGQDKKQDFRDRTGSNVVTEDEIQGRKDLGRDAADTSAPSGGTGGDDKEEELITEKKRKQVKTPKDLLELLELQSKGQAELTQKELTRIANFIAGNKINTNVLDEEKYPGIESIFQNVFDEDRLEEMINSYRTGYPDYFKGAIPGTGAVVMGMGDSLAAGKERPDGSDTLSGLKNKLTSSEIAYLKANRPDLYYADEGTPGLGGTTQGSLLELSQLDVNNPLLSSDQKRDIYAAREKINNQKEAYDARQPGLGGSMAPPPPPPPDPDPMIPVVPIPAPGTTTPIPTPKYPGSVVNDYTNMGIPNIYGNQQIPTYGYANYNQTGQPVGLQSYLDNLRKRFGIG